MGRVGEAKLREETVVSLTWLKKIDSTIALQVMELINSTTKDGGTLGYDKPMTPDQCAEFSLSLQDEIQKGDSYAILGSSPVGPACFAVIMQSRMPNCRHIANLSKGVVHPSHRGMGLVAKVFREIVDFSEAHDIELLTLDVREGTRAHLLWETLGFRSFGVLDDYARVNGVKYRGHYMSQSVENLAKRLRLAN